MCSPACVEFARQQFRRDDIEGKAVIEVGSMNVNGSVRMVVQSLKPSRYLGVDTMQGPGVDQICSVENLTRRYGRQSFDAVIATEMLEHVRDWRSAVSNLKHVLKPNGVLLLTTRSKGFPYHGFPYDFWRYEIGDMAFIFSDLSIEVIESDPQAPGVFAKARKPLVFSENNLKGYELFSIVRQARCTDINELEMLFMKMRHCFSRTVTGHIKKILRNALRRK